MYTDRATNHMSAPFQTAMNELHTILTEVYQCKRAVIIPGSGTFAMESVARQLIPSLAPDNDKVLVLRNGFFSFRWTDIFTQTGLAPEHTVFKAEHQIDAEGSSELTPVYAPAALDMQYE